MPKPIRGPFLGKAGNGSNDNGKLESRWQLHEATVVSISDRGRLLSESNLQLVLMEGRVPHWHPLDEDVEENVVESHISKLRKKLRKVLGYEIIDSKRFLGYRLEAPASVRDAENASEKPEVAEAGGRFGQDLEAIVGG